jgi:hypothetical protein
MRPARIVAVAAALALPSAAAAQSVMPRETEEAQLLELFRKSSPEKRAAMLAALATPGGTTGQQRTATQPVAPPRKPQRKPVDTTATRAGWTEPKTEKQQCEDEDWFLTLRQDWKDARYLGCPSPRANAHGAEFSFASDRANDNNVWSVNGTVALSRVWHTMNAPMGHPYRQAFGAYFTMNRVSNTNPDSSKDNVNKFAYGLAYEAGFYADPLAAYFRFRGGGVENRLKKTSASNLVLEILPVVPIGGGYYTYAPIPNVFGLPVDMHIDPSLIVQHNAATGKDQKLDFNDREEALQVGGQIAVFVSPAPWLKIRDKGSPWTRWAADFTYRWTQETYTHRNLTWLGVGAIYNLDPNEFFALGFSYQRGNDVDTGTFTDIYRVSLTGKI